MKHGSSAVERVSRWFDVPVPTKRHVDRRALPMPRAGQILLITGPSGSGKSSLVRRYRNAVGAEAAIELDRMPLPRRAVADLAERTPLEEWLQLLSRVGLAEAHTWLLPPTRLSDGQRFRLRLALALERARYGPAGAARYVVCDEFAALLDRVTAGVVSRGLRRTVRRSARLGAILATSHEDLLPHLDPDLLIVCDFESWDLVRY